MHGKDLTEVEQLQVSDLGVKLLANVVSSVALPEVGTLQVPHLQVEPSMNILEREEDVFIICPTGPDISGEDSMSTLSLSGLTWTCFLTSSILLESQLATVVPWMTVTLEFAT